MRYKKLICSIFDTSDFIRYIGFIKFMRKKKHKDKNKYRFNNNIKF